MHFNDFCNCFDFEAQSFTHPIFKNGQQIKFVYFLSQIQEDGRAVVNDQMAKTNFGVKNYKQQKNRALNNNQPKLAFQRKIKGILSNTM